MRRPEVSLTLGALFSRKLSFNHEQVGVLTVLRLHSLYPRILCSHVPTTHFFVFLKFHSGTVPNLDSWHVTIDSARVAIIVVSIGPASHPGEGLGTIVRWRRNGSLVEGGVYGRKGSP